MDNPEYQIPPASLQRLQAMMQQFEQLANVIGEAMGIPPEAQRTLNMERGVFILARPDLVPNGAVPAEEVAF
jgi:hypothetical protein